MRRSPSVAASALMLTSLFVATSCDTASVGTTAAESRAPGHLAVTADALWSKTPVNIAGRWLFHVGDDPTWSRPDLDDTQWEALEVPKGIGAQGHADYAGPFWYRVRIDVVADANDARGVPQLALQPGRIDSAYEIYVDGVRVGGCGSVDAPVVETAWAPAIWPVPASALADGSVVVAIRGMRSERRQSSSPSRGGLWMGALTLGETMTIVEARTARDRGNVIASAAILIVGLYHLQLFRRRRDDKNYLWFALFCFAMAGNMRMETEATHVVGEIVRAKLVFFFLLPASVFFIQFLWPVLDTPIRWWWRVHQAGITLYWLIHLAWPSTWFLDITMAWLEVFFIVPLLLGVTALIVRRAWAGHKEARTLFIGTLALVAALANSILVDRAIIYAPVVFSYAMILFVLSMAFSLSNRFARVFHELDTKNAELVRMGALSEEVRRLNAHVQAHVRDRSEELGKALSRLAKKGGFGDVVVGTELAGRFVVERVLGQGGMGSVYAGVDLITKQPVAIKVLRAGGAAEVAALHRFLREARAAVSIDHPAVVKMIHVDISSDGLFFQVQELVDGVTLDARLKDGPLDAATSARAGSVLAGALAAAHACGVVHRDVKPANIMLTDAAPGVKLLDFGVAKLVARPDAGANGAAANDAAANDAAANDDLAPDAHTATAMRASTPATSVRAVPVVVDDHTGTGRLIGTPAYMAPEQLDPSAADGVTDRVDVYALGLVLHRMIAGALPARRGNPSSNAPFSRGSPLLLLSPPEVPAALVDLVTACLSSSAQERPAAHDVERRLAAIADELGAPQRIAWKLDADGGGAGELTRLLKELARAP